MSKLMFFAGPLLGVWVFCVFALADETGSAPPSLKDLSPARVWQISPDGRSVAIAHPTAVRDTWAVGLWSVDSGANLRWQQLKLQSVIDMAVSPDGKRVAVLTQGRARGFNGDLGVIDLTSGKVESCVSRPTPGKSGSTGGEPQMQFTREGRFVLLVHKGWLTVMEAKTGKLQPTVHDVEADGVAEYGSVAASPTQALYAAARVVDYRQPKFSVDVANYVSGKLVRQIELELPSAAESTSGNVQQYVHLGFALDGKTLGVVRSNTLWLIEVETGKVAQTLRSEHVSEQDQPDPPVFSADGRQMIVDAGRIVLLWDLTSGKDRVLTDDRMLAQWAFLPDGRLLVQRYHAGNDWRLEVITPAALKADDAKTSERSPPQVQGDTEREPVDRPTVKPRAMAPLAALVHLRKLGVHVSPFPAPAKGAEIRLNFMASFTGTNEDVALLHNLRDHDLIVSMAWDKQDAATLAAVARHPRIVELSVSNYAKDRPPRLEGWTSLRKLNLFIGADGETLASMKDLQKLEELSIVSYSIADEDLKHLAALKNLRTLRMAHVPVGDEGVKHLAEMPRLEMLYINARSLDGFTDTGLMELARLKTLKFLSLRNAAVTEEGVAKLQKALPTAKVQVR